ncbi:uncharacterized protein LOC120142856 [Hibiscus syriacus]|uniref:uncharacterized protein LOC120142856 n=1 Tax=Hibiscus syriacus TaxID=106335 RepID=UPI0019210ACB|nr:uncharacterized protein LOC120142856 [Hibiscus syriacus]
MGLIDNSPTILIPLLLQNLVSHELIYADKSLFYLSEKYKLPKVIRYLIVTCFLFFLKFVPSNLMSLQGGDYSFKLRKTDVSAVAGALSQALLSVNDIPVSSRKYEVVWSLAERLVEENNGEGIEALREVNRVVLLSAFSRTICRLEAAMTELGSDRVV